MADKSMAKREPQAPAPAERAEETAVYMPRVDIRETENEVVLIADVPGVDETSVSIDLDGSELAIRGKFVPKTPEGYQLTYREYDSGDYERTFALGDSIDRGGIEAVVRDGVLRLTLPKAKEVQPKRIAVKAG